MGQAASPGEGDPPERQPRPGTSVGKVRIPGQACRSPLPWPALPAAQTAPLIRISRLKNQYLKASACQTEGKALLVNICLAWQSRAPGSPRLPCLAPGPLLAQSQPTAQRDAPEEAEGTVWQLRGAAQKGERPCTHASTAASLGAGLHRGRPSVFPGWGQRRLTVRFLWIPRQASFPRGSPRIFSYFGKKAQRQNPGDVLINHHPPWCSAWERALLPRPAAAHIWPLEKPSPWQWVAELRRTS